MLAAYPAINHLAFKHTEKKVFSSCCKNHNKPQKKNMNCCTEGCNPFGQCTCCVSVMSEKISFKYSASFREMNSYYNFHFAGSNYFSDCFHPPEIA